MSEERVRRLPFDQATIDKLNREFPRNEAARQTYYGLDDEPIGFGDWAALFESDPEERRVGRTQLTPSILVSTVWLGLDHGWGDGPPLIYETLIFGGPHDGDMWRYSTREEAVIGHWHAVEGAWTRRDRVIDALRNLRPVAPW